MGFFAKLRRQSNINRNDVFIVKGRKIDDGEIVVLGEAKGDKVLAVGAAKEVMTGEIYQDVWVVQGSWWQADHPECETSQWLYKTIWKNGKWV